MATKKAAAKKASPKKAAPKRKPDAASAQDELHAVDAPAPAAVNPEAADGSPVAVPEGDWVSKVAAARRAPVQVEEDSPAPTRHAVHGGSAQGAPIAGAPAEAESPSQVRHAEPDEAAVLAPPAVKAGRRKRVEVPGITAINDGLSIPEQFLLVAMQDGWDDRTEKVRPGAQGAALVGALLLDLALRGGMKIQRDHYTVDPAAVADPDLALVAQQIQDFGPISTLEVMDRLGKRLTDRIRPWKQRLAQRGYLREDHRRHLGLFRRSNTFLLDPEAQGTLVKRMLRLLAGGGNPDAQTVLLLGLCDAAGLLENLVPSSTLKFNRRRIQALTLGRDTMGYAVDNQLREVQELAVQTTLANVRQLQGTSA